MRISAHMSDPATVEEAKSITLVTTLLGGGGIERVVTTLANAWVTQGRKVTILVLTPPADNPSEYWCEPSVRRVYLEVDSKLVRFLLRGLKLRDPLWYVMGLVYAALVRSGQHRRAHHFCLWLIRNRVAAVRQALQSIGSQTIISFGYTSNVVVILGARDLKQRVIVSERNDPDYMKPFFWRDLTRAYYNLADLVTANSRSSLSKLAPYVDNAKLAYMPNPLRTVAPADDSRVSLCRDAPTILIAARLVPQKNHVQLLAAFARLPASMHLWRLAIIGEGPHRRLLEQTVAELGVADRVDWYGFVPNPFAFYYAADIFVLPSLHEGQSNALLEAMSAGLPVVVTDIPAHADVIKHGQTGLVVPVNDVERLAATLATLIDDATLRVRLGQAAQQHVALHHLDNVLPRWDQVVDNA